MAEYFHAFTFDSLYTFDSFKCSTNSPGPQISIATSPKLSPIPDRNVHLLRLKKFNERSSAPNKPKKQPIARRANSVSRLIDASWHEGR